MRYAQIRSMDISNGDGVGVSLFTQGCRRHCKGCHNPETWNFHDGYPYCGYIEQKIIDLCSRPFITRFSILGGEPLEKVNLEELSSLCKKIKNQFPHIKIWLYSGYSWEDITYRMTERLEGDLIRLITNVDVLVDGDFQEDKKDIGLVFKGSSNQRIIDVQKTLQEKEIVLYK